MTSKAGQLRMGLVGAGPWASLFHAPMLANGPGTELTAVWARRPDAAAEIAAPYGAAVARSFDELLETCDALAFCVPPDAQAAYAVRGAEAGKHLLLEKPLAFTTGDAELIVEAVRASGVTSQLMLTNRFRTDMREQFAIAAERENFGAVALAVIAGSAPGSRFATPWRLARGAIFDIGPHVLDFLEALMGPIASITATGDPRLFTGLTAQHASGAISQASLSITAAHVTEGSSYRVYSDRGLQLITGGAQADPTTTQQTIVTEFVQAVTEGRSHVIGVVRGLHIQQLIEQATASLTL